MEPKMLWAKHPCEQATLPDNFYVSFASLKARCLNATLLSHARGYAAGGQAFATHLAADRGLSWDSALSRLHEEAERLRGLGQDISVSPCGFYVDDRNQGQTGRATTTTNSSFGFFLISFNVLQHCFASLSTI